MRNIVFVCALLLFMPAAGWGMGHVPDAALEGALNLGKPAPDFTLERLSGGRASMSDVRAGNKAMVFFWATWCPHCHEELYELSAKLPDIEKQGIKVILVDLGETSGQVQRYFKYNDITLDSFIDTDNTTAESYNLVGVPTVYFLDSQGIIRSIQHHIPADYAQLFE